MPTSPETSLQVAVVGSLSMDLVLRVPRLPAAGETIKGSSFATFPGGKGNNQALAAARAGVRTAMVGKVGQDAYGAILLDTLKENGVVTTGMMQDSREITGIANIWVGAQGENSIVIVPNANNALRSEDLQNKPVWTAKVLLLQLEIPLETTVAAAKMGRAAGATTILNPAPAQALPEELLENIDIIIPNESEAELLTTIKPDTRDSALSCAQKLLTMGPKTVIITLGSRGALILGKGQEQPHYIDALKVEVVDTTAAGDAFCGAFAASLAIDNDLQKAARFGCIAGSLACTRDGAVPSLPNRQELLAHFSDLKN